MINPKYTLILYDDQGLRVGVVSTHREPRTATSHNAASPQFLQFCRSALALMPKAESITVVSLATWKAGIDIEELPQVMWVKRSDAFPGALSYTVPEKEHEVIYGR